MCGSARHRTRRGTSWIGYEVRRREDPEMRVSDADRERVAEQLRDGAAEGRLDTDELSERLDSAYAAKTVGELSAITRDLPVLSTRPERVPDRPRRTHIPTFVWISILLIAIWALTGFGYFWPVWPMLWFGIATVKHRRRAY